ncbi:MAG: hemerythrin family protein [Eubacteriales bacterium]
MSLLWSKDMEVGNYQIDGEHKQLLEKINEFYTACSEGKAKEETLNILRFLKQYTVSHFAHEEKLQEASNYPDIKRHKELHRQFILSVEDIEHKLKTEGVSVTLVVEINQKIGFWLINHIKREDVRLGKHIAEKNM